MLKNTVYALLAVTLSSLMLGCTSSQLISSTDASQHQSKEIAIYRTEGSRNGLTPGIDHTSIEITGGGCLYPQDSKEQEIARASEETYERIKMIQEIVNLAKAIDKGISISLRSPC